ncbi:MAG: tRNA glutamyl-Q(34) synthetase GluQRS [Pseudomonadota bacterium]|nr:tRNA glutamyl-Q(34) synthetase GluQRS [Pseudomonadota bacterium]
MPDPPASPVPRRGRFAPSPTGPLHAGSLLAAFGSWLLARQAGGEWWVRVEDLDPPREVEGAAGLQLATLDALGLRSDAPVVRQSRRSVLYQAALDRLLDRGLAFHCHCSRSELAAARGVHRRCVTSRRRRETAVRLRVDDHSLVSFEDAIQGPQTQHVGAQVGDFVLRRADGYWAYQLAVVVDDAAQGMTDVVRGADLLQSTPRQILLQRALGVPTPRYAHLPLVRDREGRKLSKSDAALPLDPAAPLPALRAAWVALGQEPEVLCRSTDVDMALRDAVAAFQPERIPAALPCLAASHNEEFLIRD